MSTVDEGSQVRTGRITDREVRRAWLVAPDLYVAAAQQDEDIAAEVVEVDALVEEAERAWATAERVELARVSRVFWDQTLARRAHRRADRLVLRWLPRVLAAEATGSPSGEGAT